MPNKKINELNTKSAVNTTDVIPIADPTSGVGEKTTVASLPFYKGAVTTNRVPFVSTTNTLGDTPLKFDSVLSRMKLGPDTAGLVSILDKVGAMTINSATETTILAINGNTQNVGDEQYPININSNAFYSEIRLTNYGPSGTGGLAALRLLSAGAQCQWFMGNDGFTRWRTPKIKVDVNTFIVGSGTEDTGTGDKFKITSTGTTVFGTLNVVGVSEYADNAAAITAGLTTGSIYRTGDVLKIVHA